MATAYENLVKHLKLVIRQLRELVTKTESSVDVNQMHVVVSLGNALHVGSQLWLYEFTELNFLSVGSQLPPRTLNILIDWLVDCIVPLIKSSQHVEDEHHFIFDCPLYSHIRARHARLFQQTFSMTDFIARCEPNACGGFIRTCCAHTAIACICRRPYVWSLKNYTSCLWSSARTVAISLQSDLDSSVWTTCNNKHNGTVRTSMDHLVLYPVLSIVYTWCWA